MLKFCFLIFLAFCSCNKFVISGEPFDKDEYILGSDKSQNGKPDEVEIKEKSL